MLRNQLEHNLDMICARADRWDAIRQEAYITKKKPALIVRRLHIRVFGAAVIICIVALLTLFILKTVSPKVVCREPGYTPYFGAGFEGVAVDADKLPVIEFMIPEDYPQNISRTVAYYLSQADDDTLFWVEASYLPEKLLYNVKVDGYSAYDIWNELMAYKRQNEYLPYWVYTAYYRAADLNASYGKQRYTPYSYLKEECAEIMKDLQANHLECASEETLSEYAEVGAFAKEYPDILRLVEWYEQHPCEKPSSEEWNMLEKMQEYCQEKVDRAIHKKQNLLNRLGDVLNDAQLKAAQMLMPGKHIETGGTLHRSFSDRFWVCLSKAEIETLAKKTERPGIYTSELYFWDIGVGERDESTPEKLSTELSMMMQRASSEDLMSVLVVYMGSDTWNFLTDDSADNKEEAKGLLEVYDRQHTPYTFGQNINSISPFSHGEWGFRRYYGELRNLTKSDIKKLLEDEEILYIKEYRTNSDSVRYD